MATSKRKPARVRQAAPRKGTGRGGGSRVSGSVNGRLTLFGGSLVSIRFGGKGRRGRQRGVFARLRGLFASGVRTFAEARSGGSPGGGSGSGGGAGSFEAFKVSRPDLFGDDVDQGDGDGLADEPTTDGSSGGGGGAGLSRRWDRAPETDRDRRFFDLRGSGYAGPIDQDGYAVDDDDTRRRGGAG